MQDQPSSSLPSITQLLATISSGSGAREVPTVPNPQVSLGYGIPSIPQKTRDRILAGEYIDFTDLPPAKGKTCPLSLPASEGNIIMVNAFDLMQQKKLIPDIGTWVQCFTIFAGVICSQSPGRLPDLLGYLYQITRASQRYKWPAWVIFDQNFRQEVADRGSTELAHLDPTLYAQCFNGQTKEGSAWCHHCHSLEHSSDTCPLKPPPTKLPRLTPAEQAPSQTRPTLTTRSTGTTIRKAANMERNAAAFTSVLNVGGLTLWHNAQWHPHPPTNQRAPPTPFHNKLTTPAMIRP